MNAFPMAISANCISWEDGMTLRDYFAGQALIGIITHPDGFAGKWKKAAEHAYEAADAMIEAREKSE
jgi:hypothetical protein